MPASLSIRWTPWKWRKNAFNPLTFSPASLLSFSVSGLCAFLSTPLRSNWFLIPLRVTVNPTCWRRLKGPLCLLLNFCIDFNRLIVLFLCSFVSCSSTCPKAFTHFLECSACCRCSQVLVNPQTIPFPRALRCLKTHGVSILFFPAQCGCLRHYYPGFPLPGFLSWAHGEFLVLQPDKWMQGKHD